MRNMRGNHFVIYMFIIALTGLYLVQSSEKSKESKGPRILNGIQNMPSDMPLSEQKHIQEQYAKFMAERNAQKKAASGKKTKKSKNGSDSKKDNDVASKQQKKQQKEGPPPPAKGISPRELGLVRPINVKDDSLPELTEQVTIFGGEFWFGSQLQLGGVLSPGTRKDGAEPRKRARVKDFKVDIDCVTNRQFAAFVKETGYATEAELYGWSFVFEGQASAETISEVDGETGYGRVKDALHWLAVKNATWLNPYGLDSTVTDRLDFPVVQVSYLDAVEYCAWAGGGVSPSDGGLRLLTEKEWEYAARGGRVNESYPWGDEFIATNLNIWGGKFPKENDLVDRYYGIAPVKSFPHNAYGVHNMLGNVWEWVSGGDHDERVLRGGSFIDSKDGSFNHLVMVSTKQTTSGDSAASNVGFRCGRTIKYTKPEKASDEL